jgi:hypothetical protein
MYYLKSRHGIVVTKEEVRATIMKGLQAGGAVEGEDNAALDIMELTAILLIPILKKSANELVRVPLPQGAQAPPPNLIPSVLNMMLEDVCGPDSHKKNIPLTSDLLRRIFEYYGEVELSKDTELLNEMLDFCQNQPTNLDADAFARALTYDVALFDLKYETTTTANKNDILLTHFVSEGRTTGTLHGFREDTQELRQKMAVTKDVETVYTAPCIDTTASTYQSKSLMVNLYVTVLLTYFANVTGISQQFINCDDYDYQYDETNPWTTNAKAIICDIGASIVGWFLFFVLLCIFGVVVVGFASYGNDIDCRQWYWPAAGCATVMICTFIPVAHRNTGNQELTDPKKYLQNMSLYYGVVVCIFHFAHIWQLVAPDTWNRNMPRLANWLNTIRTGLTEYNIKQACSYKLNKLTENALNIMRHNADRDAVVKTNFSRGLYSFKNYGTTYEPAGGLMWTWKNILYTKLLYQNEGVCLSARILSANICQFIVACWLVVGGYTLSTNIREDYNKENVTATVHFLIDEVFSQVDERTIAAVNDERLASLEGVGLDADVINRTVYNLVQLAANEAVESLYPASESMVMVPILIGVLAAVLAAIHLTIEFRPSVTSTILKLRCGLIPLRGSPNLRDYRVAPESVAVLTGSLFWGALASSVLTGGVIGLIAFFFMWQATAIFAQQFLAIVIGLLVISVLQLVISITLRTKFFVGFYRKRPAAANLSILALEWSSFPTSSSFIFARMIQLFFISLFSIGRIDTPLLAPGVGKYSNSYCVVILMHLTYMFALLGKLGPLHLDDYPTIFMRDILAHEAHRHPVRANIMSTIWTQYHQLTNRC